MSMGHPLDLGAAGVTGDSEDVPGQSDQVQGLV